MTDNTQPFDGQYVEPELSETARELFNAMIESDEAMDAVIAAVKVMANVAEAALKDNPELAPLFAEGDFIRDTRLTAGLPIECARLMAYFWAMPKPE